MLSNHLRNTYTHYNKTTIIVDLNSSVKQENSQNFENNQENKKNNKEHFSNEKNKVLSTHDKVMELDKIVHSSAIMSTLILKSKLANIS